MRTAARIVPVVLAVALGCGPAPPEPVPPVPPTPPDAPPDDGRPLDFTAQAHWHGGPGVATFRMPDYGSAAVTLLDEAGGEPEFRLEIILTPAERAEWRIAFLPADFFGEWGRQTFECRATSWDVTASLGPLRRERKFSAQPEFEPAERFLWRLQNQARVARSLRQGRWEDPGIGRPAVPPRFLRPAALLPDVAECAAVAPKDYDAGEAATALLDALPPAEWLATTQDLLARVEGSRREYLLRHWAGHLSHQDRDAHRRAFLPIALAEVRAAWPTWDALSERHREIVLRLLSFGLLAGDPTAVATAEEMVRTLSTRERTFQAGLHYAGAAAVPVVLRLAEDGDPVLRAAAACIARSLVAIAKGKWKRSTWDLPYPDRDALAALLGRDLVPVLERLSAAPEEPHSVRTACFETLHAWQGRDLAAEAKAASEARSRDYAEKERAAARESEAKAERRAAGVARWNGKLAITGHLFGPEDAPLEGFVVVAQPEAAPPEEFEYAGRAGKTGADGSFRIEGLVEGRHHVVAVRDGPRSNRDVLGNGTATPGVLAGGPPLVLRFPGRILRGRLFGEDGQPLTRRNVVARMRDAPNVRTEPLLETTGWDSTDREGRFSFLQLLPGRYDVEVPGCPVLAGASDLDPGPAEHEVRVGAGAAIEGRVIDERGDPIAGAVIGIVAEGRRFDGVAARTRADGTFRLGGLPPGLRGRVVASIETVHGAIEDVLTGATALEIRIDASPRVEGRVEFGRRKPSRGRGKPVRLVRVGEGAPAERTFVSTDFLWRGAPQGTWRVLVCVQDLDTTGNPIEVWVDLGTVRTGDPARTFVVPD